jgi:AhpD family alkylhydroperoxidase
MKFDNRMTELVAVGASVAANCQSCVEYHVGKAAECGVDRAEVAQAIDTGRMVRRGAAAKMDKLVATLQAPSPAAAGEQAAEGCGCSA